MVRIFQDQFPGQTSWAIKANPHPVVVRAVSDAGICSFDVASRDEIERVLAISPWAELHFNHPIKSFSEIVFATQLRNVTSYTIDSFEEIEKIDKAFRQSSAEIKSSIAISTRFRSRRENTASPYRFGDKFGATPDVAAELFRTVRDRGYRAGLSFHVGSQNRAPGIYGSMIKMATDICKSAGVEDMRELDHINIGGGFPCMYPSGGEPDYKEYFAEVRRAVNMLPARIICEPGRAIVANSIHLVAKVLLRRGTERRIYINDGFYGSFMELPFVDFSPPSRRVLRLMEGDRDSASSTAEFDIWGPTCDSIDRLPRPIVLNSDVQGGDYIEFAMMGAYTNATATTFNGIPSAKMALVEQLHKWWEFENSAAASRQHSHELSLVEIE